MAYSGKLGGNGSRTNIQNEVIKQAKGL